MERTEIAGNTLVLSGLPVTSPVAFLAALGLMRVCCQDHSLEVQLSWSYTHARLHGIGRDALVELLAEHMRGRSKAPEFNFTVTNETGKQSPAMHMRTILPGDFRAAVAACRSDARALGFLAGFGTDAVITDKGFIARNRLDFSSGQQRLIEEFRALAAMLDPGARKPRVALSTRIERALFGGPYEEQSSFGWDPAALMSHAHQPIAPTDSATPGQPMTIWLAVESLALHPVVPAGPRRARTTGFARTTAYVWPQWETPLSFVEVAMLRQRPVETLSALPGVTAVWSSTVTSVGKYGFLRPGARILSDGTGTDRFAHAENAE